MSSAFCTLHAHTPKEYHIRGKTRCLCREYPHTSHSRGRRVGSPAASARRPDHSAA
jgi:carbonic anhydrase